MNNGTSPGVIAHFNRVASLPDEWDHNRQYQRAMLAKIPPGAAQALEIGCGTGEFCLRLAEKCVYVTGIDVAPGMIEAAEKRNAAPNIRYALADAAQFLAQKESAYDVIASIAAFHHLDEEEMLRLSKRALRPGGVLLLQDLYEEKTAAFRALSLLGAAVNPFFLLVKTGRPAVPKREREIWAGHGGDDFYSTLSQIKARAAGTLGRCEVRRRLFWRYTLFYQKESG